jgi:RNA-directed DNA polymerase
MQRVRNRIGNKRVLGLVKAFLNAGILSEDGIERDTVTGTPQGGLCAAPHNPPYEQRLVMHSVDPSSLVRAVSGAERCA